MINPITLKETNATPSIHFDIKQNIFEICGCSRPENVRDFYLPIVEWLECFCQQAEEYRSRFESDPAIFKFKLTYFNSASAKFILDIMMSINNLHSAGIKTSIDWFYEEGDDDMLDVGAELSEMVDFDFRYVILER